jgi:predicted phosphodiesterase
MKVRQLFSEDDYRRILDLARQDIPYAQIAGQFSKEKNTVISKNVIVGIMRDIRNRVIPIVGQDHAIYGVGEASSDLPIFMGELDIEGDATIISDVHIPLTDYKFLRTVIPLSERLRVKQLIIAGDLFDMHSQSSFPSDYPVTPIISEIKIGRAAIKEFFTYFDRVYYFIGNHELRLMRTFQGGLPFSMFMEIITPEVESGKMVVSPYDRAFLYSGDQTWGIFHQKNTSVNSLSVGEKLAHKYQCNTIVTHQHNTALGYDRYGNYVVVDIGGLHEPKFTGWTQLKTTTGPRHDKGYATVIEGQVQLWTPDNRVTDWSLLDG